MLLGTSLTACGEGEGGTPVLGFYSFNEPSGAYQKAVDDCTEAANGRYRIEYNLLPADADGQRQQLVRRLAADDSSIDLMALDVTWIAEFAEAEWIREWTDENRRQAEEGILPAAIETATWQDRLYAAPYTSNTQLLWYRTDLVPTPPQTWDEMIRMADDLAAQGKPSYIEIQGAQYEGLTVWFNSMVESAGGTILSEDGTQVELGAPAERALQVMSDMANSEGADPSLSNTLEDQARLAMESGVAAFELNYPFVYPSMQENNPELAEVFQWAPWPSVNPGEPSRVTIGGIDLGVSAFSKHPDEAFEAALCMRNEQHQLDAAVRGGLPPTRVSLYDDPAFVEEYPFAPDIRAALETASVRPKTPAYQNVSIVISNTLSPPSEINPRRSLSDLRDQISDALESKGLVP